MEWFDANQVSLQIIFAYEDEKGGDIIESIDFWKSSRRSELPTPSSSLNLEGGRV